MPVPSLPVALPFGRQADPDAAPDCTCDTRFVDPPDLGDATEAALVLDGDGCPGGGDLASNPACRATAVGALAERDAGVVRTRARGTERTYDGVGTALLLAAGRFVERAAVHDRRLAARARRDPLGAAREATGRAGPVATVAAETGLAEVAAAVDGYEDALAPAVAPTVADSRVETRPPPDATLADRRDLDTGASVRRYRTPDGPHYHLEPPFLALDPGARAALAEAHARLADGTVSGGRRAPGRAVRRVADADAPVETLTRLLRRYTRGYGMLEDLFADPRVSDVFATAPVDENPVRVVVDGDVVPTNVRLSTRGAAALASRFRRTSGRAFSRASPTLDAVVSTGSDPGGDGHRPDGVDRPGGVDHADDGDRIRVAGVTDPASDGIGFAFRAHGGDAWTLPGLVANGTVTAPAAALLSFAVERSAAVLVAGPRGAGKTTLLGALLWELPASTRTVVMEDTPELPTAALRRTGRDVQGLRTGTGDGPSLAPAEALRTALRLGEGALVVGEVRGEEAAVLYEAMRVGATGGAVLGTIHGDGARAVRERVVTDLGVPPSSFAATDLVVTLRAGASRRVAAVEEVRATGTGDDAPDVGFETLYDLGADGLRPTGTVDRGDSVLVGSLAAPDESYADVRARLAEREDRLATLAATDRTRPADVARAYRRARG